MKRKSSQETDALVRFVCRRQQKKGGRFRGGEKEFFINKGAAGSGKKKKSCEGEWLKQKIQKGLWGETVCVSNCIKARNN